MFASKLKLSDDVSRQKSTKGKILEWMQEHPNQCKDTNSAVIAKAMAIAGKGKENTLRQTIQGMVNNQMLFRYGNRRRSDFYINYMHKDIPPYVLEKAPEADKNARKEVEDSLEENQHVDEVGCVVTKTEEEPEDDKTHFCGETLVSTEDLLNTKCDGEKEDDEDKKNEEHPELDEIIEQIANIPVMVHKKRENGSTNISITLNINLNN